MLEEVIKGYTVREVLELRTVEDRIHDRAAAAARRWKRQYAKVASATKNRAGSCGWSTKKACTAIPTSKTPTNAKTDTEPRLEGAAVDSYSAC